MTSRKPANIKTIGYGKELTIQKWIVNFVGRTLYMPARSYVCVCIYVCIYVYMYVWMYVCMYVKQRLSADTGRNTLSRIFNKLQIKAESFQ